MYSGDTEILHKLVRDTTRKSVLTVHCKSSTHCMFTVLTKVHIYFGTLGKDEIKNWNNEKN